MTSLPAPRVAAEVKFSIDLLFLRRSTPQRERVECIGQEHEFLRQVAVYHSDSGQT
jgi:hypothetical protein